MSVLNAFLATWTDARRTFGAGVPETGERFDSSVKLREMQGTVRRAAPDDGWQGPAADAYAAANEEHAQVFGKLADLDVKLSGEITNSAQVVTSGRTELDRVRDWVLSAASSVPANQAGETMMMSVVTRGLSQVSQIIRQSNSEMNTIAGRVQALGQEYEALGIQKFAGRDLPTEVPDDDDPFNPNSTDVAQWYADWEAVQREITAHNAAVAAHLRARPPSTNVAAVAAWNAEGAVLNAEAERIYSKQIQLAGDAVGLGIPTPTLDPPQTYDDPDEVPQGTVPPTSTEPTITGPTSTPTWPR